MWAGVVVVGLCLRRRAAVEAVWGTRVLGGTRGRVDEGGEEGWEV